VQACFGFGFGVGSGRGLGIDFRFGAGLRGGARFFLGLQLGDGFLFGFGFRRCPCARFDFLPCFGFGGGARFGFSACFGGGLGLGARLGFGIELRYFCGRSEIEIEILAGSRCRLAGGGRLGKDLDVTVGGQLVECLLERHFSYACLVRQIGNRGFAIDGEKHQAELARELDGSVLDLEYALGGLGVYRLWVHAVRPSLLTHYKYSHNLRLFLAYRE
jgi:hypothetical protein